MPTADRAATEFVEQMLAQEKRGLPPPGTTWCLYWRDRFTTLQGVSDRNSHYAQASRSLIAYIKRRRAEEGLPPCDKLMGRNWRTVGGRIVEVGGTN